MTIKGWCRWHVLFIGIISAECSPRSGSSTATRPVGPASRPAAASAQPAACPKLAPPAPERIYLAKNPYEMQPPTEAVRKLVPVFLPRIEKMMQTIRLRPTDVVSARGSDSLAANAGALREFQASGFCPLRIEQLGISPNPAHPMATGRLAYSLSGGAKGTLAFIVEDESGLEYRTAEVIATLLGRGKSRSLNRWFKSHPSLVGIHKSNVPVYPKAGGRPRAGSADGDGDEAQRRRPSAEPERSLSLLSIHNTTDTGICLYDGVHLDGDVRTPPWALCWQERRAIKEVDAFGWRVEGATGAQSEANDESKQPRRAREEEKTKPHGAHAVGFVGLWLDSDRVEVWAMRYPGGSRVLLGVKTKAWYESLGGAYGPERRKLSIPQSGWIARAASLTPDLGPLHEVRVIEVPSETPGLSVLVLDEVQPMTESTKVVCARWKDRWRCSSVQAGRAGAGETNIEVRHSSAYVVPSREAALPWIVLDTTVAEREGRNGPGSQSYYLDIYRLSAETTIRIGSLLTGKSTIEAKTTPSYSHTVKPAGEDCLRFGKTDVTAESAAARRAARARRVSPPTRLAVAKDWSFALPCLDDPEDETEYPPSVTIVPLTGAWRLSPREMVRISPSPKGSCVP
jgi:hypothetical protein